MEQQYVSDQDFIAVIRTILLFLDSQNFKETCSTLIRECEGLGYPEISACPQAALTCRLSSEKAIGDGSDQRFYKSYKIESKIDKDINVQTAICLYYVDTANTEKNVSSDLSEESQQSSSSSQELPTKDEEEPPTEIVYKNEDLIIVSSPYTFGGQITEEMNCDNKSPANDVRTNGTESIAETAAFQIIPHNYAQNDAESNTNNNNSPTRGSKRAFLRPKKFKGSSKKHRSSSEKYDKNQRYTSTNGANTEDADDCVETSSNQSDKKRSKNKQHHSTKEDCFCCNVDCHDLKIKLHDLQKEHKKLMGVAAELTLALQSNILGQSENLNHMLNNCKKIYPDLFSNPAERDTKSINSSKFDGSLSSKSNKSCNTESPPLNTNPTENEELPSSTCDKSSGNDDPKVKSDVSDKSVEQESFQIIEGTNENVPETDNVTSESSFEIIKNKVEILRATQNENTRSFSARSVEPEKEEKKPDDSQNARKNSYAEKNEMASDLVSEMCDIAFKQSEEISLSDTKSKTTDTQSDGENKDTVSDEEKSAVSVVDSNEPLKDDAQTLTSFTNNPKDYFELNFRKIKNDLIRCPYEKRLRLLQALRWRITKTDANTRDIVMGSYIRHDLLSLHKSPFCNLDGTFLEELYCPYDVQTPHPIQESIARLVNAFASLTVGRDYLCQDDKLLSSLILPLTLDMHRSQTKIDDITRDMLLATLQKLSLRNRQRHLMISSGLVEYLITFLTINHDILSDYCMEYCTALFMNLCLHKEAREACKARAPEVIILLVKLLNEKHSNCIPYVNGAMYSLLSDPIINREALDMDLTKIIEQQLKRSNGEIKKQLEIILKIHLEGDEDEDCVCDSSMDVQEEVDLLEPELDMREEITNGATGEELLNEYKLSFIAKGNQQPNQFIRLCQPITPRSQSEIEPTIICPKASRLFMVKSPRQNKSVDVSSDVSEETIEPVIKNFGSTQLNSIISLKKDDNICPKIDEEEEYQQQSEKTPHNNEEVEKTPQSPSSSVASTEKSFSEETKQFYHKPSAKRGIFDTNPPASFTRTIVGCTPAAPMSLKSPLHYCYHPKEMSSTKNTSNTMNFYSVPKTCYRENYKKTNSQRDKYKCQCYNELKEFIEKTVISDEQTSQECNNNNEKDSTRSNSVTLKQKPKNSENLSISKEHICGKKNNCDHICDCTCYRAVFKSRPKILRTP